MSKSVGNVDRPVHPGRSYGVDQLRYFFLREVPFGQDGNYSHEAIVNRINADLANDLGNLAQRSLSMIGKAVRRRAAGAGRVQRQRQGDPGGGRRHDRQVARDAMATQQTSSRAERGVGRGRRSQPLFRRRGALGAGQDRSGAAEDGAVRYRGSDPADRDPGAAVHAGVGGQTARLLGDPGGRSETSPRSAADSGSRPARQLPAPQRRCFRATSSRARPRTAIPCSSTAIAIWISRISPTSSTRSWRGRRPPGSGAW